MFGMRRYRLFLIVATFTAATVYYFINSPRSNFDRKLGSVGVGRGSLQGHDFGRIFEPPPPQEDNHPQIIPANPLTEPDSVAFTPAIIPSPTETVTVDPTEPTSASSPEGTAAASGQEPLPKTGPGDVPDGKSGTESGEEEAHYSTTKEKLINLPQGQPKKLAKVQYDFEPESPSEKKDRLKKQDIIKKSFLHAWDGYKKYAYTHDELKPISRSFADPPQFMGWGATLVDSLDSLLIMDLNEEFEEAVKTVGNINFKNSTSEKIPMFETTIRYLGGLISAYDLGSTKLTVLLDKAVELADVLLGAFETPNHMPVPYYLWASTKNKQSQRSHKNTVLAEIGSMTMEFTRLAQLTGEDKYYDAVARITHALETWQMQTEMPGLWSLRLDASGCSKTNPSKSASESSLSINQNVKSASKAASENEILVEEEPAKPYKNDERPYIPGVKRQADDAPTMPESSVQKQTAMEPQAMKIGPNEDLTCKEQGLTHEPGATIVFGIGGQADSVYEYLPKMFALLGGLNTQYRTMYENAMKTVRTKLLFRPMIEDAKRSILFSSRRELTRTDGGQAWEEKTVSEVTHLTCFAGGMFGLAAKLFGLEADMDIAKRLTDGCIWAYESMPTGIMAEDAVIVPCDSEQSCEWNEKKWHEALDANKQERLDAVDSWNKNQIAIYDAKEKTSEPQSDEVKIQTAPNKPEATVFKGGVVKDYMYQPHHRREAPAEEYESPTKASSHIYDHDQVASDSSAFAPKVALSHEKYVQAKIQEDRLPPGYIRIRDPSYILRPEAIESVFIMWRLTGDKYWRQKGWTMFQSIQAATQTEVGNAALRDVRSVLGDKRDKMESFWLAETLKYFYLLFSEPDLISLDEYVFNTEAHPFRLPK